NLKPLESSKVVKNQFLFINITKRKQKSYFLFVK
ncbi:hypothetical protein LEP1GSC116_0319, partial [Leptospira interrogans serovar Icterohaemorrhagiae str. Verdun HP]